MAAESTTVEGADRFATTLRSAADEVADLPRAQKESVDRVAAAARSRVPVVSGNLRATIRAELATGEGRVSVDAVYAAVIHNGWAARNIRANPFLTDALDDETGTVAEVYTDDVDRVVGKIKGK